ncbi:hypothetical protein CYY_005383 [Polysphondylium violaceum]|uniref:RCC1-like domain-containing protein n=1 Tax=Polysphondylium violaceum TaxID=133409 RepID=A0A8J4US82_9MYCE|nr:hypothetical protein CYY_005383 [Polysphondylium violaceum]
MNSKIILLLLCSIVIILFLKNYNNNISFVNGENDNDETVNYTQEQLQELLEAEIAAQEQPLPTQLLNITAKDIYANSYHSAYITEKGQLYHWGLLANSVTETPEIITIDGKEIEKVSLGGHFLLIKTRDGLLYSMGRGTYGVLGLGQDGQEVEKDYDLPQLIQYFIDNDIKINDISSGFEHSIVSTEKGIYSFGRTNKGQLGVGRSNSYSQEDNNNDIEFISTPQRIDNKVFESNNIVKICSGSDHNLVLTKDNKIYSWGNGYYGSLGHGDNKHLDTPKEIEYFNINKKQIRDIACGGYHSLALTEDGELYSWGWAELGQLGLGSNVTGNQLVPTRIQNTGLLVDSTEIEKITSIQAGAYATSFYLTDKGSLYSFGWGEGGSLGLGDGRNQFTPVIVAIPSEAVSVAAGFKHTIVKDIDGTIFVFGDDTYSQTGSKQNLNYKQVAMDLHPNDATLHTTNHFTHEQIKALL